MASRSVGLALPLTVSALLVTTQLVPAHCAAASDANRPAPTSAIAPSSAARIIAGRVVAASRIDLPHAKVPGAHRRRGATPRAIARARREPMTSTPPPYPPLLPP